MEILTVLAIVIGPIAAIVVSRFLDKRREEVSRRMDIFRTLMRTRRTPVYPDHVGALNLIEIEFANDPEVIGAWTKLFEHFGAVHGRNDREQVSDGMAQSDSATRNNRFAERLAAERQKLLAKLLHAIAKRMGFSIEQLEVFEGGYTPQGWHDIELEQRVIRQFAVDLYFGHRVVPVAVIDYRSGSQEPSEAV